MLRLTRIADRAWPSRALPLAFLTVFFVWPVATIIGQGSGRGAFATSSPTERLRGSRMVHAVAGDGLDGADARVALPGAYVLVALPLLRAVDACARS